MVGSGHVECCNMWGSHSSGRWAFPDDLKALWSFRHRELLNQRQHHIPEDLNLHAECCAYILSLFFLPKSRLPKFCPSNRYVQPVYWRWTQQSLYLILQPSLELQHTINVVKGKGKDVPVPAMKAYRSGCMVQFILISALDGGEQWASHFSHFMIQEEAPVPTQ